MRYEGYNRLSNPIKKFTFKMFCVPLFWRFHKTDKNREQCYAE